jgi:DHA2 family multidrug resistance protein
MGNEIRGTTLLLLNIFLGLGTFIQILDTSIANVAIPYIAGSLSVSPDQGTWVITSFSASNAVVLPLTGWLSDYFGRVKLFVYSVILFAIASFLCGFSSSLPMLIFFRVLQGAVAGSLIPLSQSLILLNNPPEKQGSALGFWAMIVIVAPVVGPILGGYITEVYTWPWIFYINVPIGLISALGTWFILKDHESAIKRDPIDWFGLFLLCLGVGSLQIMLDKGKDLDWFESNVIIALTVVALVSLTYFIFWNYFARYPIVDFKFFADRNFTLGTIVGTLGFLLFFAATVVIPLWLQTEQNYTAYWAGVAVAPIGIVPVLFSSFVGKNLNRVDVRAVSALSFLIFGFSYLYFANFTTDVSLQHIMLARLYQGIALTIFFIPIVQITLTDIPKEKYASASGIFNFIRILIGSGFGTSLSITLWSRLEIFHHSRLTEVATTYNPLTAQFYELMQAAGFKTGVIDRILDRGIEQQAYMLATNDIMWVAAWLSFCMVPIPFLCKKVQQARSPTAATSGAH